MIVQEILHLMNKSRAKKGFVGFKIDISKAFDMVEWDFLLNILLQIGFHRTFIGWIQQCISTTSMSLLLNGSPYGYFKPSRGLRQGDPISPYLFIIVMECLSRLFHRAEQQNIIKGITISRGGPTTTHLLFVDDLLILARADEREIAECKNILDKFCTWSGLSINLDKSGAFFF